MRGTIPSAMLPIAVSLLAGRLLADAPELTVPVKPGRSVVTIRRGEFDRVAHIQIPTGYRAGAPPPLVVTLHGAGGNGRVVLDHNGWSAKAEKHGFIVAAPDGLPALPRRKADFQANPSLWNSGQLNSRSPRAAVDDVAYIRQLLDELKARAPYDPKRVYCAGHSNGGTMAGRLALDLSDRLTAVGIVAGLPLLTEPRPARPLPTLTILGTRDPLVPLDGGEVRQPWGTRRSPPVSESLAAWARAMGCVTEPRTTIDRERVKRQEYPSRTPGGPALTVLLIEGHGHQWPGSKSLLPESLIGPQTDVLNATDTLWEFFSATGARTP